MAGSSPRVWGIHWSLNWKPHLQPVHPHVCGEYGFELGYYASGFRFIPTCVGNTHVVNDVRQCRTGSSPRVWGILNSASTSAMRAWFIPTCVGNTGKYRGMGSVPPVHPHVCGEYIYPAACAPSLVRFIPTCVGNTNRIQSATCFQERFIPTCVGNTATLAVFYWCGVRFIPTCVGNTLRRMRPSMLLRGSSPRVWGILIVFNSSGIFKPVHPHVCGEYFAPRLASCLYFGSSPRVWGIL